MLTELGRKHLKEVGDNLILVPKVLAERNLNELVLSRASSKDGSGYYYEKGKNLFLLVLELPSLFCTSEFYYSRVAYGLLVNCKDYIEDSKLSANDIYYLLIENRGKELKEE